jgi:hypothetical protein
MTEKNVAGGSGYQLVYSSVELETYGSKMRCAAINGKYPCSFHLIARPGSNMLTNKVKGTVHPETGHEGPEGEEKYSSTLSLTSVLDGMGSQRQAPANLTPGKTRYPLYRRQGGVQGRSGLMWKISPPLRFGPRTVQPIASRCTA